MRWACGWEGVRGKRTESIQKGKQKHARRGGGGGIGNA